MFGVWIRLSKTASARKVSTTKRTTFGPSGVLANAAGSIAATTAAPAEASRKRRRVTPLGTQPGCPSRRLGSRIGLDSVDEAALDGVHEGVLEMNGRVTPVRLAALVEQGEHAVAAAVVHLVELHAPVVIRLAPDRDELPQPR